MTTLDSAPEKTLFGHPRGLTFLFTTEMWERFSYYGMRALLVLYLTKYLFLTGHVEHVLFYPQVKAFYEMMFGPLGVQPLSSLIYGTYTGLIYATPWLGGWVADNFIGQRKAAIIGIVMMAFGHFMMASEGLLFPALTLLIFGGGFFKTNTSAQVGMLYQPGDERRDRAYSIYLCRHQPWRLCRAAGRWHIGRRAGLALRFRRRRYRHDRGTGHLSMGLEIPARRRPAAEDRKSAAPTLDASGMEIGGGADPAGIIPLTLWWACYEQQGNIIALFADANTDRRLIPGLIDWRNTGDLVPGLQPFHHFRLHTLRDRVVDAPGHAASGNPIRCTRSPMAACCWRCLMS